jgi:hypothetical protein
VNTEHSTPPLREFRPDRRAASKRQLLAVMDNEQRRRWHLVLPSIPPQYPRHRPARHGFHRPVVAVALVVAALAGAGVAVAAGLGAFEGTPAPPEITSDLTVPKQIVADAIKQGMAQAFPQADVSRAHGVIEIQTPDGPQDLWAAPNDQGGQCYFIDYANDPVGSSGGKPGTGGCFAPDANSSSEIVADGPEWSFDHPDLLTIYGTVEAGAATVKIALQDGSTLTAPVAEHFYLASIPKPASSGDAKLERVTAFDAAGNQVANWTPQQ